MNLTNSDSQDRKYKELAVTRYNGETGYDVHEGAYCHVTSSL